MNRILVIGVVLMLPVAGASATNIWVSPSGAPAAQSVAEVDHDDLGQAGSLDIWVQPDADKTLLNLSLNVRSTDDGVLDFTGASILSDIGDIGLPVVRFENVKDSNSAVAVVINVDPDSIDGFQGFTVLPLGIVVTGLGPLAIQFNDPNYDSGLDAFLLGRVEYVTTHPGSTNIFLQIGDNGANNQDESSADLGVVFGDPSDPALNGELERNTDSATPDATITATPEPSSVLLLVLGALGLLAIRRR
jgi:hypothetical protein